MHTLQQLREEGDREFDNEFPEVYTESNQIVNEIGMYINPNIKIFIHQERTKAFQAGQQNMLERVRNIITKEMDKRANIETVQFLACDDLACEILKALDNLTK